MKKAVFGALVFLMCCSAVASAQGGFSDIEWDATAALDMPMGDLADFAGVGFGIGTDIFFWSPSSDSPIQVGGRIAYNYFTEDVGTASTFELVPTVRYNLPSKGDIQYFGQAGLGIFIVGAKVDVPSYTIGGVTYGGGENSDSETHIGISLGGGAIVPFAGHQVVLMPLLNLVEDANYLGLNFGILMP